MNRESSSVDETTSETELSCLLSTTELQKRKTEVLARLFSQIHGISELDNGYSFKFNYSDGLINEIFEFIKAEKQCCSFFTFHLIINGIDANLQLSGPKGVKEFIRQELGLKGL
jgi:hypothetical protein